MNARLGIAAIGAALAVAGAAAGAHAAAKPNDSSAAATAAFGDSNAVAPNAPRKSMQWDTKGRWGLKLDYQQPAARGSQLQSIDAGAFYKLTPSVRIGGSVGFAGQPDPRAVAPDQQPPQPRVRLETTFKF